MENPLKNVKIIGYFSMPSPTLAELNPDAYNNMMKNMPAGAGICSHCGTGILHHVVIRDENGVKRFIGMQCAEKTGLDKTQVKYRITDEEKSDRIAKQKAIRETELKEYQEQLEFRNRLREARYDHCGDILDLLKEVSGIAKIEAREKETNTPHCLIGGFYADLYYQLRNGNLSAKQAYFVAKATSASGRRNKKNAKAWDDVVERCTNWKGME